MVPTGYRATFAAAGVLSLLPGIASAHVKWFCATVDVAAVPRAPGLVFTPLFGALSAGFLLLVFLGFLLDGVVARRWPRLADTGARFDGLEEKLARLATGGFFLLLWDKGAFVLWGQGDALLTPELRASAGWLHLVQLGIAVAIAWRGGCLAAAAGILVLYGYGIAMFGLFHMTDYVFFPGLAGYLALTWRGSPAAHRWRAPLLSGSLAFSLMWTAIEKFVYPQWTLAVVAQHPALSFGFDWNFVVVVAGFVEFTLAFYIMTGRGLVRLGALAYALIFLAAMPEFGHLDEVGHLPIVAILAVVALRGGSPAQRLMGVLEHGRIPNAAAIGGLYAASVAGFFALYYGLHWAQYG